MSKLLIPESPLQFLPTLNKRVGCCAAVLIQQIFYLQNQQGFGKILEGERWIFGTVKHWAETSGFSEQQVKDGLRLLRAKGCLLARKIEGSFDHTMHYRVVEDHSIFDKAPETNPSGLQTLSGEPSDPMIPYPLSKTTNPETTSEKTSIATTEVAAQKVVRQKKVKEPQEPGLIKLAEKIHGYITRKMKEHNLLPGTLKFDTEVTANILRQIRDIDQIPEERIGTVLAWTWSYEFDNGTLYGSVLTSPAQWRNRKPGASTNKFQNAYASWLRETGGVQDG